MRNLGQRIGGHRIGIDPRPLHVGDEHLRPPRDAEARVNALLAFIDEREVAPFDVVDTIDGARRGRHVAWLDHRRAAGGSRRGGGGGRGGRGRRRSAGRQTHGRILLDVRKRALGTLREIGEHLERLRHARIAVRRQRLRARQQLAQPLEKELAGADAGRQRRGIAQRGERHAAIAARIRAGPRAVARRVRRAASWRA